MGAEHITPVILRIRNGAPCCFVGRVYVASLPVAQIHPDLGTLYVHRSIGRASEWTVSHLQTGCTLGRGKSRAAAMRAATQNLTERTSPEFMQKAIAAALERARAFDSQF